MMEKSEEVVGVGGGLSWINREDNLDRHDSWQKARHSKAILIYFRFYV